MLRATVILSVLPLPLLLNLSAVPAVFVFSVPAYQIALCIWRVCSQGPLAARETATQCVQKVKLDQRFGPGLVRDGECIRFPGLILPCPTFHYPSFWLDFKGPGQRTLQSVIYGPYHRTTFDCMCLSYF